MAGARCQMRGQGRICPTAAEAAVCHRPAPLATLVLPGLIYLAQGQAPRPQRPIMARALGSHGRFLGVSGRSPDRTQTAVCISAPFVLPARRDARVSARRVETTKRALPNMGRDETAAFPFGVRRFDKHSDRLCLLPLRVHKRRPRQAGDASGGPAGSRSPRGVRRGMLTACGLHPPAEPGAWGAAVQRQGQAAARSLREP